MKVAIGIVTYGESTTKYLPYFLSSLKEQSFTDYELLVYDNTEQNVQTNRQVLEQGNIKYELFGNQTNLGFGKAYNILIDRARELAYDYFLLLNVDMIFDRLMLERLVSYLDLHSEVGAVTPKILRWDFANKQKTNFVDSYGLTTDRFLRFFDSYQGQVDTNQIADSQYIFGFTGAAALARIKALQDIAYNQEYFDEQFFMYKEDCDLSLRLRLSNWQIAIVPDSVAYHDRTVALPGDSLTQIALNRKNKSRKVKQWSFLNQLILLYKFSPILPAKIIFNAWVYELASIAFAAIFETYLLREIINFCKLRVTIKTKSTAIPVKLSSKELEELIK